MKKLSKIMSLCLSAVLASSVVLSGCGKSSTSPKTADDTSSPVELTMYLMGSPAKDYDQVLAELNKKAKADLNATLKVNWISFADVSTKYPLVLASGENIDLIYTATWLGYYQQAQKGAFKPLEEIGPKYAPKSFEVEPKEGIKQATVDGHVYTLPANNVNYNTYGAIVRGDLMKKYGITDIKTLDDYGKFLNAVVENDKNLDPTAMYSTSIPTDAIYLLSQGLYPIDGSLGCPFWVNVNDPTGKIVNMFDKADMPDFLAKMKSWSSKGYWPKSVLSNKDDQMLVNDKAASRIHNIDNWVSDSIKLPQYDLQYVNFVTPSYPQSYVQDGMAIPTSSKNPERALMLLEKLRNDRSYYNLLTYGIEGKHYEITSDNQLKGLDQEGFAQEGNCSWGFRDSSFKYDLVGSPSNLKAVKDQIKSSAVTNKYTSFNMNVDPVKNEYAAIQNVITQYYVPLKLGYVDPVSGLADLKEKLKVAGIEKVQAEFQKQLDEFVKNNK